MRFLQIFIKNCENKEKNQFFISRCDYAVNGAEMTVNKDVERVIGEFVLGNQPIGLTFTFISEINN